MKIVSIISTEKDKLWNNRHSVENKTDAIQHVLRTCCLSIQNAFLGTVSCVCSHMRKQVFKRLRADKNILALTIFSLPCFSFLHWTNMLWKWSVVAQRWYTLIPHRKLAIHIFGTHFVIELSKMFRNCFSEFWYITFTLLISTIRK